MQEIICRVIITLCITWLYCNIWVWLEKIIEGQAKNSLVDNIIVVLFIPIIYMATETILKWIN